MVLDVMERQLLTPSLVEAKANLIAELGDVRREIDNLIEGLSRTGASSTITTAIKQREER